MVMLRVEGASKSFTLHLRGSARIEALRDLSFTVAAGECVVLRGPSGAGKSSVLKMVFGNYRCDTGRILLRDRDRDHDVDIAAASPRQVLALRRTTIAYVSQFLRVVPRVPALDLVAAEARAAGVAPEAARHQAAALLGRLNLHERLWDLPPATFSGGEQQRVNIARGFVGAHPVLLLDEPTASLDARNRAAVIDLIRAKKRSGTAMLGIFHDEDVRDEVADRLIDVAPTA